MKCPYADDPVSKEALDAAEFGVKFGCGHDERQSNEIARLRNVVQVALLCSDKQTIIDTWNKYFPHKPLTVEGAAKHRYCKDSK